MPTLPRPAAPLALLLLALLLPAAASATITTIGSTLQTPPNAGFGCESVPQITGIDGSQTLVASGQPDCTWRQTGVFGSDTDPRFSSVPGDGRITKVEVLTGANPAPLRFVIIRQLGNVGGTANSQCCFFKSETLPMPMRPNQVNTFDVNIPVERNTLNGIRAFDLVAISATTGQGTLPLLETGPHNINTVLTPGAVDVGYFYPRMGANPNDAGGGRLEAGTSGLELTVRWTWVSADDPSLTPGGGGGGGGGGGTDNGGGGGGGTDNGGGGTQNPPVLPKAPTLAGTTARIKANRAPLTLRCAAAAACAGKLQLLAPTAKKGARAAAKQPVSYGKATYKLKAGGKATVKIALTPAARKLLRKRAKVAAVLQLTPTGGKATTKKVTLRR